MLSEGSFWRSVAATTRSALASGALQPVATTSSIIEDGGVRFVTRVVANLERKRIDATQQRPDFDPFAEPEPELVVGDLSETHYAVLNKFNVVDQHVLVVTRAFEEQESWLTADDFAAIERCLSERDALVFYNAGPDAGASQRHKHLQIVPVPLGEGPERAPIETVLRDDERRLPFPHAVANVDLRSRALEHYRDLLAALGHPRAYNLVATRDWMLAVPRVRESWHSISVNALGFAGALLVRSAEQLAELRRLGPMRLLRAVSSNV